MSLGIPKGTTDPYSSQMKIYVSKYTKNTNKCIRFLGTYMKGFIILRGGSKLVTLVSCNLTRVRETTVVCILRNGKNSLNLLLIKPFKHFQQAKMWGISISGVLVSCL